MTNEPEWMERFDKKFHGALNQIEIMANVHPHDVGKFYSEINSFIQSTIKKEKEKSFVEGQMAGGLNAFPICIEEIEKAKAELLSKIEEEKERIFKALTVDIDTSQMLDGWEKYWVSVGSGRYIEGCIECENSKRIKEALLSKYKTL